MSARIDTQTIARYRRGSTAYVAEQNGEPKVMHSQTFPVEPVPDTRFEEIAGWLLLAVAVVLGFLIGVSA